ncbi:MAG TPA: hypothetical protein VF808_19735 [Ktedonobacterales bacterium]
MNVDTARRESENACARIDAHYATALDCQVSDLHAGEWRSLVSLADDSAVSRSNGLRQVLYLLAPVHAGARAPNPGGVALLAHELRVPIERLLNSAQPRDFFQPARLTQLDRLVRDGVKRPLAPGCEPRLCVWYATPARFTPYRGPWIDWIDQLDPHSETNPLGRSLLARYAGGVFVVRIHDSIIAYAGLRASSGLVWELTPPQLTASGYARLVGQQDTLMRALLARATRAAHEAERIPICTTTFREVQLRRSLVTLGFRHYAHASAYATAAA